MDLARHARKGSASGFVNAVLRSALRQRNRLPFPPRPGPEGDRAAAIAYLGITHSHPDWLVARWLDRLGLDAAERWVRFNNETPRLTLRANTLRASRERVAASLAPPASKHGQDATPPMHSPSPPATLCGFPRTDRFSSRTKPRNW